MSSQPVHDVIVIGSGPAGYTAAVYASRAMLNPIRTIGTEFSEYLAAHGITAYLCRGNAVPALLAHQIAHVVHGLIMGGV